MIVLKYDNVDCIVENSKDDQTVIAQLQIRLRLEKIISLPYKNASSMMCRGKNHKQFTVSFIELHFYYII